MLKLLLGSVLVACAAVSLAFVCDERDTGLAERGLLPEIKVTDGRTSSIAMECGREKPGQTFVRVGPCRGQIPGLKARPSTQLTIVLSDQASSVRVEADLPRKGKDPRVRKLNATPSEDAENTWLVSLPAVRKIGGIRVFAYYDTEQKDFSFWELYSRMPE